MTKVRSQPGYERTDAPPRLLALLAGGLALSIVIVLAALALAFPSATGPTPRGPLKPLPPEPQLQADPDRLLQHYRQAEAHRLSNYAPAAGGHVRLPIDKAMNEVAAQGWSDRK